MAEFKPTESQRRAIELRGCPVLVSAGAGSGKTRVLTERLMAYLTDLAHPVDIDSFLIITYTRAAAGELRGRISEELSRRLASEPGNSRLRRQSALLRRAKIGTIHSFCADLLRENCQAAGLTPDFKILDEERAESMRASCLDRVLEDCYDKIEDDPDFRLLADTVGEGRDDRSLAELILELHEKMQCHAFPAVWAEKQTALLASPASDAGQTPWGRELMVWAKGLADHWSAEFDALLAEMSEEPRIKDAYAAHFEDIAAQLRELSRCLELGWDKAAALLPLNVPRLPVLGGTPNEALSEKLKTRRTACIDCFKKKVAPVFASPSSELLADMAKTAPAMRALLRLTLTFDRAYAHDKQSRGLVDYADLEHKAAALLIGADGEPTELARRLSQRYTEVMVDEYQDVSRVQDAIFTAVSDEGRRLFLVGDVKQSIYRFRLADPAIFNEKYRRYAEPDSGAERVLLRENFRSRREILDAANAVFSLCMSETLGDVDYNDEAALVHGAAYYEGAVPKPELLLCELPEGDDEESPDKTALEAAFTAKKIRALVESGATVTDGGGQRPMDYGDIAILLRSPGKTGGIYREALINEGVPVGSAQGSGFFTAPEIALILAMLTVMDNPHKDIPLIAVLRSAAFGFTPDELSYIRAADKNADFYTALEKAGESNEKCRAFLARLASLRAEAADLSAAETVWRVMEELDLPALCSAMDDGARRRENLMALVELSEGFESTGYRGLHRFSLWLQARASKGQEPNTGVTGRAVQIVSIHRSKGLEYPVVFLCDAARRFNTQERSGTVLVHPVLGLGPRVVDLKNRVRYPSLARLAIAKRQAREDLSEEMRLLYVALTRAKERLFVVASCKDAEKAIEKADAMAQPPVAPESLTSASSFLPWLLCACIADGEEHFKIRVCRDGEENLNTAEAAREAAAADPGALEELRRRLSFAYPHQAAVELPSKVTATELKGRYEKDGDAEELLKPKSYSFRMPILGEGERSLTATERGVATHLVLQYMDFSKAGSREGIRSEIQRLKAARYLSAREAEAVNVSTVERLFHSELGRRMLAAKEPLREFRFSLLLDADRLYPGTEGEQLLLQGVVDCCLEEDGALVIIDYKTDNVRTEEEMSARAELYHGQLAAYAEALGRIFQKPVKEGVLYFLGPGREIRVI